MELFLRLLLLSAAFLAFMGAVPASAASISGRVLDRHGPVGNATVRVQGTAHSTDTDASGFFTLSGLQPSQTVTLSAWKKGYYAAMQPALTPPASEIAIKLIRYPQYDNPGYRWIPPTGSHPQSCDKCHDPTLINTSLQDPHLHAARNHRFLTVYFGTDTHGDQTASRRYKKGSENWATAYIPLPYSADEPYYGPGFRTDLPGTAGSCSGCHLPGASVERNVVPPNLLNCDQKAAADRYGADTFGILCDFCHKVADLKLDAVTRLPFRGLTGVHAMEILRPSGNKTEHQEQLFFGPYDDPNSTTSTRLPLLSQSQFCAACHRGFFWNKLVYNSYGEWLQSPYGKEGSTQFKTCQQCHMSSPVQGMGKLITNTAPGKGGLERPPATFRSHKMTIDQGILSDALTMNATAKRATDRLWVEVELYNDKTGHHIPSDSPLRHLILHVEARDCNGTLLQQLSGPVLPDWCGSSGKVAGITPFAGKPGKAYAKLLKERWTNEFPTVAYWNDFDIVSDNRLAAFSRDTSRYEFKGTEKGKTRITVSLYYRRAYYQLMEWKQWTDRDILMAQKEIVLP